MIDKIYYVNEFESLLMNDKGKCFIATKNNDSVDFKELILKMNELERISKDYVSLLNNYEIIKDQVNLKELIDTAIYTSTALLFVANGFVFGEDNRNIGLFMICLNFVILKSVLTFVYGTNCLTKNEQGELTQEMKKIKSLYDVAVGDINRLLYLSKYSELPASDEKIKEIKKYCKKTYQLKK